MLFNIHSVLVTWLFAWLYLRFVHMRSSSHIMYKYRYKTYTPIYSMYCTVLTLDVYGNMEMKITEAWKIVLSFYISSLLRFQIIFNFSFSFSGFILNFSVLTSSSSSSLASTTRISIRRRKPKCRWSTFW